MSIVRKMRKIKLRKRATACAVLRISSLLYGLRKDDFPVLPHLFRKRCVDSSVRQLQPKEKRRPRCFEFNDFTHKSATISARLLRPQPLAHRVIKNHKSLMIRARSVNESMRFLLSQIGLVTINSSAFVSAISFLSPCATVSDEPTTEQDKDCSSTKR